jgi:hypothetical protein
MLVRDIRALDESEDDGEDDIDPFLVLGETLPRLTSEPGGVP